VTPKHATTSTAPPVLVWFRQDLRVADNPALLAAAATGAPVIPLYILDEKTPGVRAIGAASRWWLHGSLTSLSEDLHRLGSPLVLRCGPSGAVLAEVLAQTGARTVYWNRCYEPYAIARDRQIKTRLRDNGIETQSFNASLLFEPWTVTTKTGGPYRVFSPFWRACMQEQPAPESVCDTPTRLTPPHASLTSDMLADWRLTPSSPDWAAQFPRTWTPGSAGAHARLAHFLDTAAGAYKHARDLPAGDTTSGLSPHLHYGDISPRQVYWAAHAHAHTHASHTKSIEKFVSELGWREFAHYLLYHFPHMAHANYQPRFDGFAWRHDAAHFTAWCHGRTGYPMVDAGMRQLWQTGWMHNRVRMIAASFLVKHLMIHWREGEAWFWDTLVDADLANNAASWQWVAGSGADAAPYFRIFNPVTQGVKFDPDGAYIRQYVQELKDLPSAYIHAPWTAPAHVLDQAGITLGRDYPLPVVEHADARRRALAAFDGIKKAG